MIPRLIDEIPVIAVAAACAEGTTVIRDAAELAVKESNRITSTVSQLAALGAAITEQPDGMTIEGGRGLRGGAVESFADHRLAMALAVAGLVASGDVRISGAEAVAISYPEFWTHLARLTGAAAR
jgi:3-phosphoshikimate 1-carboxyvinyltransferase